MFVCFVLFCFVLFWGFFFSFAGDIATHGLALQLEFGRSIMGGARGICNVVDAHDTCVAVCSRLNGTVAVFYITSGTKKRKLGVNKTENYQLSYTDYVTYSPSKSFFVLESAGAVVEFDADGKFKGKYYLDSGTELTCKPAYSIDVSSRGLLFIGAGNTLSTYSPMGQISTLKGKPIRVKYLGIKPHYIAACGKRDEIAVSGDGYLEIIDLLTGKVKVKRPIPKVAGLCYSEDSNYLHVVQRLEPYGPGVINRHSAMTGDFIALECDGLERPGGATLVCPGTLAVADWQSVKVFT